MAKKNDFKLTQTKGSTKLQGIIVGKNENSYTEGTDKNNNAYRVIKFGLKTSTTNIINVELYAGVREFVYPYSSESKTSMKVAFAKRNDLEPGFHVIGISVSLPNEENKFDRTDYIEYDAVKVINDTFEDGDSVYLSGEIVANQFANQSGEMQDKPKFTIKSIKKYPNKLDLNVENYIEMASFEQEIVIEDTHDNEKEELVEVNARVILYADRFKNVTFVIEKKKTERLAHKFLKLKFGDFISVQGSIESVELVDNETEEDEWGSKRPKGFSSAKGSRNRLVISAVSQDKNGDTIFEPKKYKLEDFDAPDVDFNDLPKEQKAKQHEPIDDIDDDETPF